MGGSPETGVSWIGHLSGDLEQKTLLGSSSKSAEIRRPLSREPPRRILPGFARTQLPNGRAPRAAALRGETSRSDAAIFGT